MARGEEHEESDLDVCIITQDESQKEPVRQAAERIFGAMREQFGVTLSMLEFNREEFIKGYRSGKPLFREILRDALPFFGPDLAEVTGGKKSLTKDRRASRSKKPSGHR
ncbi:MAG: hypothetical protein HYY16_08870 [Planctomycetes bacterium]|nr:hypothetical protein [Planctomycetota bacterium]